MTTETRLTALHTDDADALARLANDRDVTRFTSRMPYPYGRDDAVTFIAEANRARDVGVIDTFAIRDGKTGTFIGCTGYETKGKDLEIGYWLGRPYWGQGHATRAVQQLVRLLARVAPGRDIIARVHLDNPASANVLKKCGFIDRGATRCNTPARETEDVPATLLCLRATGP